MQAKFKPILLSLVIAVAALGPAFAFAQTENDVSTDELTKIASEAIAGTVIVGGAGGAMGILYSIMRVSGKSIRAGLAGKKAEPIVIYKVVLTALVGAIVGSILGIIGIPAEQATAWDFVVVVFVTEIIMPNLKLRSWKGTATKPGD
jgi:uncharacterized membrane protein YbjE (DUF340 family)